MFNNHSTYLEDLIAIKSLKRLSFIFSTVSITNVYCVWNRFKIFFILFYKYLIYSQINTCYKLNNINQNIREKYAFSFKENIDILKDHK